MKKILGFFLAAAMILSLCPAVTLSAAALDGGEIALGADTPVELTGEDKAVFSFTPAESGVYLFSSSGPYDTVGEIRNASQDLTLASDDESGSGSNFAVAYEMTAGVAYTLTARFWWGSGSGSFTVRIEKQVTSGSFGDGLTWSAEDGVLTIGGAGAMPDFDPWGDPQAPWASFAKEIASVVIGEGVTRIGDNAFRSFPKLTSVSIPSSVTFIGTKAFYSCSSLCSISIGENVETICMSAFEYCPLSSVTLPDSVTEVGDNAFSDCRLAEIHIGKGLRTWGGSIGNYYDGGWGGPGVIFHFTPVTGNAGYLSVITVEEGNPYYTAAGNCLIDSDGVLVEGCMGSAIPADGSVTSIGRGAFFNCINLKSVTIPESVTEIGEYAFYNCSGLTTAAIPAGVGKIGSGAFAKCTGLTSLSVAAGNPVYHSENNCVIATASKTLVAGCRGAVIPADGSVTAIGGSALRGIELDSLTIPDSVESVGDCALYGAQIAELTVGTGLKTVDTLGMSVSGLKRLVLADLAAWMRVEFGYDAAPNGPIWVGDEPLTELVFPEGTESIGSQFAYCKTITSVSIPASVTEIDDYAFSGCSGLTSVTIPASVERIGDYAFASCTNLASIEIPDSVTEIGYGAFSGCTGLASVTLPDSALEIGSGAFFGTAFYNNEENWENGALYIGRHLINVRGSVEGELAIRPGTVSVANSAVSYCSGITSLVLPASVVRIGSSAFSGCTGLASVTIPEGVETIGGSAFGGCTALSSCNIPLSVKRIGWGVFDNTPLLTGVSYAGTRSDWSKITLDESIGKTVFYTVLTSGSCGAGLNWSYDEESRTLTFTGSGEMENYETEYYYEYNEETGVTIAVPITTAPWSEFAGSIQTVVLSDGMTSIGDYAFMRMDHLTLVTGGSSLARVGRCAFYSCPALGSFPFGEALTAIGDVAFYSCASLPSLLIPAGVAEIGNYAFFDCSSIASITVDPANTAYRSEGNCLIERGSEKILLGCGASVIPDGVKTIGDYSFWACKGLTALTIPKSVTTIEICAVQECADLKTVSVAAGNPVYHSAGNCVIDTANKILVFGCGTSVIPADKSVTSIAESAFCGAPFTKITIPPTVTEIGNDAFDDCRNLSSIVIPDSVTSIGEYAFIDCTNLTSVTIGSGVTSIGYAAFIGCDALETVVFRGTEEEWKAIEIEEENDPLLNAGIRFEPAAAGDLNGDGVVTAADAIYLLYHTFYPEDYPSAQSVDFNGDGVVTAADAIHLLYYTFYPDDYPLA